MSPENDGFFAMPEKAESLDDVAAKLRLLKKVKDLEEELKQSLNLDVNEDVDYLEQRKLLKG